MQAVNGFPVETLLLAGPDFLAAPIGVTATAAGFNQINVSWLPVTNATGYVVRRGGVVIASVGGTSYSDTGLSGGTTYAYTVLATNADSTSPVSLPATATTPTLGSPPTAGALLAWDANFTTTGDQDGNGIWNASMPNWWYGGGNVSWLDNCTAVFGAGATTNCTVTLLADVAPAGITVTAGCNYTLAGTNAIFTANGLNVAANGYATISAVISGTKGLTNTGTGGLMLSGTNAYTGGTSVKAGTVNASGDQSAATGGWDLTSGTSVANFNLGCTIVVAGNKSIGIGGSSSTGNTLYAAGLVTNYGALTVSRRAALNVQNGANWIQTGTMSVAMPANSGYSASMTVYVGGAFTYAGANPISLSPSSGNAGSAALTNAGGTFVTGQGFANNVASSSGSGTLAIYSGGTLRLTTNVASLFTTAGSTNIVTLGGGGGVIDTGSFSTSLATAVSGSGSLTKLGTGTLTLSASNTYAGGTTISNGTLWVNGSLGTGAVMVATGGTLGGTGTVNGAVTVNGTVAPGGSAVGILTTTNETWNGGGALQFSLNNATNSSGWALLKIAGWLNLQSATNNPFFINLVSLTASNTPGPLAGFASNGTYVWTLATVSGGIQNFNPSKFAVYTAGFSSGVTGTFSVSTNAGALLLTYTGLPLVAPVVAPAALAAGGNFGLTFSGPAGQNYHVYASTNLALPWTNWLVVTGGVFGAGPVTYSETITSNPSRFFRVSSP
jgi:autotransporter-associated beta strand protein